MKKILIVLALLLTSLINISAEDGVSLTFPDDKTITGESSHFYFYHSFLVDEKEVAYTIVSGDGKINVQLPKPLADQEKITVQVFNHGEDKIYEQVFTYSKDNKTGEATKEPVKEKTKPVEPAKTSYVPLIIIGSIITLLLIGGIVFMVKRKKDLNNLE